APAVDASRRAASEPGGSGARAGRRGGAGTQLFQCPAVAIRGRPGRGARAARSSAHAAARGSRSALRADVARGGAREPARGGTSVGTAAERALPALGHDAAPGLVAGGGGGVVAARGAEPRPAAVFRAHRAALEPAPVRRPRDRDPEPHAAPVAGGRGGARA